MRGKHFLGSFGWMFTSSLQMWICAGILGAFLTTASAHLISTTPSNHFPGSTPPPPRRIPSSSTSRSTLYFSPPTALFCAPSLPRTLSFFWHPSPPGFGCLSSVGFCRLRPSFPTMVCLQPSGMATLASDVGIATDKFKGS